MPMDDAGKSAEDAGSHTAPVVVVRRLLQVPFTATDVVVRVHAPTGGPLQRLTKERAR